MTGSEIKSVKYNEDLFKIPTGTQKRKKKSDKAPLKMKQNNTSIRKKIMQEYRKNTDLKEKQKKSVVEETKSKTLSEKDLFDDSFRESVKYMQEFADKHKEESKLNKTIRNVHNDSAVQQVIVENNNNNTFSEIYSSPPAPKYGCLKNGSLPTYRSYCNRTVKSNSGNIPTLSTPLSNTQTLSIPIASTPIANTQTAGAPSAITGNLVESSVPFKEEEPLQKKSIAERIKSPAELLLIEKVKQKAEPFKPKPVNKKIKKILRRTYRTGKNKYRPKVSVLLPNKTIRRNVTTKSYLLKQTPIEEIRKTLLKQGFIKVGSSAPNDVLRKMYESVQMIGGDINNHNPDNLLYNFFNDKTKY